MSYILCRYTAIDICYLTIYLSLFSRWETWYCDTLFMEADDNQQMNGLRDWWGWHFNSCQWLGQVPKNHFLGPRPPIWFKEHIYEKWWLICLLWKPHQRCHTFNLETHNSYLVKYFHYFMISTTNQAIFAPHKRSEYLTLSVHQKRYFLGCKIETLIFVCGVTSGAAPPLSRPSSFVLKIVPSKIWINVSRLTICQNWKV